MIMHRRTAETEAKYQEILKSVDGLVAHFADRPAIKEYKYWKIVANSFPYDNLAVRHHMLVPKRVAANTMELEDEEVDELMLLKSILDYEIIWENLGNARSVGGHYHLHLMDLIKDKHGNN
jgi:diadenosine tetraphosphate (Ap4A) HIT family hydrolase